MILLDTNLWVFGTLGTNARAERLLVQIDLTGEYDGAPIVTAENTLTLLRKETGIGYHHGSSRENSGLVSGDAATIGPKSRIQLQDHDE